MNFQVRQGRIGKGLRVLGAGVVLIGVLVGCGAPGPLIPDQQTGRPGGARPLPAPEAVRVSRGDTLYSIAFRYGLDWRDVARWNAIGPPYTIHVDDWIRLQAPPDMRPAVVVAQAPAAGPQRRRQRTDETATEPSSDAASPPRSEAGDEPRADEADQPAAWPTPAPARPEAAEQPPAEPETARASDGPEAAPVADPPSAPTRSVAGVSWRWPTDGRVARDFDNGASRKGILIAGQGGQPIRAAAQGEVVYSGNGLIGYGELIIIKHSDRMLSAYAHNRERLVAEGDRVRSGDLIARMGTNARDETVLHFEIRRDGKPADPVGYLPRGGPHG